MTTYTISYYIPGEVLLPQVPRLRYQFCANLLSNNLQEFRRVYSNLEVLPYSLGAASLALFDLARDQVAIVGEKAVVERPNTTTELNSSQRDLLGHRLDAFLDSSRRAQNAIVPYLRRKFPKLNIAKSLSDVVHQLRRGVLALPDPLREDIVDYWEQFGGTLKEYRDLVQHYLIVGTEAKVVIPLDGDPALLFCLPNNPAARPISELRYDEPQVHVQQFVFEQFLGLLSFLYSVLEDLLDRTVNSELIPALGVRTPFRVGSASGIQAYIPARADQVDGWVQSALSDLRAHFGGTDHAPNPYEAQVCQGTDAP